MRSAFSLPRRVGVTVAMCLAVTAAAFALAPRSCTGGLETYVWLGALTLAALGALPYLVPRLRRPPRPLLPALGGVAIGGAVWVGAFFAADFRILCRLF